MQNVTINLFKVISKNTQTTFFVVVDVFFVNFEQIQEKRCIINLVLSFIS